MKYKRRKEEDKIKQRRRRRRRKRSEEDKEEEEENNNNINNNSNNTIHFRHYFMQKNYCEIKIYNIILRKFQFEFPGRIELNIFDVLSNEGWKE